ncbi:DUF4178 domain-containing protein [Flammeovirga agarivorans]|uniref:DUF4178 domain-containing protein n=1 Tax=Flammeovirga agarivorans TaxID=2726742 RepID=A0A7X8SLM7_9BACT|nr:DUF4178 domain-containing protein [Flammeovirga agarivorans]NLR92425.1 DUF4178 domain-containing protein [Flammeovirga agarivorans]
MDWPFSTLLIGGSLYMLYHQSQRLKNLPDLIFSKIGGVLPYKKNNTYEKNDDNYTYDPSRININDIQIGFLVDYNLNTYHAVDHIQYVLNKSHNEERIQLNSGIDELYLFKIKNTSNHSVKIGQKINIYAISDSLDTDIFLNQKPKSILRYKEKSYFRDKETRGSIYSFRTNKTVSKFVKWDYWDEERTHFLSIIQKDVKNFSAFYGKIVSDSAFSEILPKK